MLSAGARRHSRLCYFRMLHESVPQGDACYGADELAGSSGCSSLEGATVDSGTFAVHPKLELSPSRNFAERYILGDLICHRKLDLCGATASEALRWLLESPGLRGALGSSS